MEYSVGFASRFASFRNYAKQIALVEIDWTGIGSGNSSSYGQKLSKQIRTNAPVY